jgi:hypothetical protein
VCLPGEEVLLSSKHLSLSREHPKFFAKFVGPFIIKELRGVNTVELRIPSQTRFGLINEVVNVDRLRPYKRQPPQLGSSEEDDQPEALDIIDPRGGTWWEVEDVMAHRQQRYGRRFFLVRYKGFGPSFDEWKREEDVSEQLIREYDELCRLAGAQEETPAPTSSRRPAAAPKRPDSAGVGALRPKSEIEMSGQLGAESRGHAHLGGVLVGFSPPTFVGIVCGN